jgi:hypothetical protein
MLDWLLNIIVFIVTVVFSAITMTILLPFVLLCIFSGLVLIVISLLYSGWLFVIKWIKNLFGYV